MGANTAIELTRRQQRLYTHEFLVFAEGGSDFVIDPVTSEPIPTESSSLRQGPYRGLFTYTENVDDPTGVMRLKRFNLETADILFTAIGAPLDNAAYVVNVTRLPSGKRHPQFGQTSRVMGDPRVVYGAERRPVNQMSVRIEQDEHPPDYIKECLSGEPA